MNRNFIKVAAANIQVKLLDVNTNKNNVIKFISFAHNKQIDIINFPELTLTGVSAGEMLGSMEIINKSRMALKEIVEFSKGKKILISLGLPIIDNNCLYSCQAFIFDGRLLSLMAKSSLNKDQRQYMTSFNPLSSGSNKKNTILNNQVFFTDKDQMTSISFLFEDDLYDRTSRAYFEAIKRSNIVFIIGSHEQTAMDLDDKKHLFKSLSKKDNLALIYTGASANESSTNGVYSGQKYIFEDGNLLEASTNFKDGLIYTDINMDQVRFNKLYQGRADEEKIPPYQLDFNKNKTSLYRKIEQNPMVPSDEVDFIRKCKDILNIQAYALIRRLNQLSDKKIFLGLSGGLDSTQALIVACLAYELANWDKKDIHAIIMPGLGTSSRTKSNAHKLAQAYGVSYMTVEINESVRRHFLDINHDENDHSIVYENAQARERTQILMDLSNKHGGIVLGTGNMSEIALGFSTYNGDHMSMYAINAGLTKTLLKEVVRYVKNNSKDQEIKEVLGDILATPISPELLPAVDGEISQKTEDNIGPYELHDFFLYHTIRNKSEFANVVYMCKEAYADKYSLEEIVKYYKVFLRRFSIQQFKRTCMPDGPAIEDFSLNPRNGFTMASDVEILRLEEISEN